MGEYIGSALGCVGHEGMLRLRSASPPGVGASASWGDTTGVSEGEAKPVSHDGTTDDVPVVAPPTPSLLARELRGTLPCARCRYDLKGLSVRSVCPECGTPVRGTILAMVDPHASELQPIFRPRATAVGLILWAFGALGAVGLIWLLRISEFVPVLAPTAQSASGWIWWLIVLSGVGSLVLINPHRGIPARIRALAAIGCIAYVPMVWLVWLVVTRVDANFPNPYADVPPHALRRALLRLAVGACIIVVSICLRPAARLLVARSLVMRTGRVDRQTLLTLATTVAMAMLGDLLHIAQAFAPWLPAELCRSAGVALIAVGSLLFTIGLVGVAIDCVRLRFAVLTPPLSMADLLGPEAAAGPPAASVPARGAR